MGRFYRMLDTPRSRRKWFCTEDDDEFITIKYPNGEIKLNQRYVETCLSDRERKLLFSGIAKSFNVKRRNKK